MVKYFKRLGRWIRCRHKWTKYRIDDVEMMLVMTSRTVRLPEGVNYNCEGVRCCSKCGEVRSYGKKIITLYAMGSDNGDTGK